MIYRKLIPESKNIKLEWLSMDKVWSPPLYEVEVRDTRQNGWGGVGWGGVGCDGVGWGGVGWGGVNDFVTKILYLIFFGGGRSERAGK